MGATQRELATLAGAGIIERREKGKKIFYQANNKSPIFKELRSLLTKTAGAGEAVKKALLPFKDHIEVAFLYGSAAEGAFRSTESDIDLMVIGQATFSELSSSLRPAEELLGREINPTIYTTKEFKKKLLAKHSFILSVLKRPKVYLFGGEYEPAELEKNNGLVKHKPSAGEIAGAVTEGEAKEMFQLAKELRKEVAGWLGKAHPELLGNK